MKVLVPPALRKRATIGIISPASPQRDESRLDRGVRYLEGLGYSVKLGAHVHARHGNYLAGTDAQRIADIHSMFSDPQVDAIFCARGGYGCTRLLPFLNFELIRRHPKIFVGFSDITALNLAFWHHCRLVSFSGAMPSVEMADTFDPLSEEQFWKVLTWRRPCGLSASTPQWKPIRTWEATGRLLGGNLSVLTSMLGTAHMPSLRSSVTILEDVGEATYRIDRMLTHLSQSTRNARPAGLAYGFWSQSAMPPGGTPDRPVLEMLSDRTDLTKGPILSGLMYGHEPTKLTLPFGLHAKLTSARAAHFSSRSCGTITKLRQTRPRDEGLPPVIRLWRTKRHFPSFQRI
jgi:muramoyltetrapeptide carboxypeptidase